jgi:hypothetical protein
VNLDFTILSRENRYILLGATVAPRPIAWVSSLGEVLMMHVADDVVLDLDRAQIRTETVGLVGQMGPNRHVDTVDTVEQSVPSLGQWRSQVA